MTDVVFRMEGHRAVVIGAGGAIGSAICAGYAGAGASVCALDFDAEEAAALAGGLAGDGHTSAAIDVTEPASVESAAGQAFLVGPPDSVVYAAGVATTGDVVETEPDAYVRTLAVNLEGAFHVGRSFGRRLLRASTPASLAFLASTAGRHGEAGASAYCASKFGLIGFVESFAAEVASRAIRVNAICPGNVDSPMLRSVAQQQGRREGRPAAEVLRRYADASAGGRLVRPEEVAGVALWLASPLSSGVTGASIVVDVGGPSL